MLLNTVYLQSPKGCGGSLPLYSVTAFCPTKISDHAMVFTWHSAGLASNSTLPRTISAKQKQLNSLHSVYNLLFTKCKSLNYVSEWASSFLRAHQLIKGHLMLLKCCTNTERQTYNWILCILELLQIKQVPPNVYQRWTFGICWTFYSQMPFLSPNYSLKALTG